MRRDQWKPAAFGRPQWRQRAVSRLPSQIWRAGHESAFFTISLPCRSSSFFPVERRDGAEQRNAAPRQDAFLDGGAGGMQRIVDPVLPLLRLDLGGAADADHRNAPASLASPEPHSIQGWGTPA
jgi:hypothetical protein